MWYWLIICVIGKEEINIVDWKFYDFCYVMVKYLVKFLFILIMEFMILEEIGKIWNIGICWLFFIVFNKILRRRLSKL